MAIARLTGQDASNTSATTSVSAVYASTPTAGNLLVACVDVRGTASAPTIPGWSVAAIGNGTTSVALTILYKVADGSESTTVTATRASATAMAIAISEYSGLSASPLDAAITSSGTSVATLAIGPTATLAQADELAIAAVGLGGTFSAESWTNSFNNRASVSAANAALITADQIVAATTALSTTASWTTNRSINGAIATFKGAAPGGAAATHRMFGVF